MFMWRLIVVALTVLMVFGLATVKQSHAYCSEYLPLTASQLSLRVKQRLVCDNLSANQSVRSGGSSLRMMSDGSLRIAGVDRDGLPWSLWCRCHEAYASVWSSELDGNNAPALLILSRTGATSTAWEASARLLIVSFDRRGRPVPWQSVGFFEVDSRGVKDLVDLDRDGKAEVIVQEQRDGYWLCSLYETANSHFSFRHAHAGWAFPLHTKFTFKPNRTITRSTAKLPAASDISNDGIMRQPATCLRTMSVANKTNNFDLLFDNGKKLNGTSSGTCAVVLNDSSGRRIALLPGTEARELLLEIKKRKIPLMVSPDRGSATGGSLIWAEAKTSLRDQIACRSRSTNLAHSDSDSYLIDELP